jgi:hypothetical protein
MQRKVGLWATALVLLAASEAGAQVTGGVMWVNNTHMA